jgi:hypothetical protein
LAAGAKQSWSDGASDKYTRPIGRLLMTLHVIPEGSFCFLICIENQEIFFGPSLEFFKTDGKVKMQFVFFGEKGGPPEKPFSPFFRSHYLGESRQCVNCCGSDWL